MRARRVWEKSAPLKPMHSEIVPKANMRKTPSVKAAIMKLSGWMVE